LRQPEPLVEDAGVDLGGRGSRRTAQAGADVDLIGLAGRDAEPAHRRPARRRGEPLERVQQRHTLPAQLLGIDQRLEVDGRALRRGGLALGGRQQDQHRAGL
jgi:hypothetical protein